MFQDALHDQLFTQVPGDLKYQPTVGVETVKLIDIPTWAGDVDCQPSAKPPRRQLFPPPHDPPSLEPDFQRKVIG